MNSKKSLEGGKEVKKKRGYLFYFICLVFIAVFIISVVHFEKIKKKYQTQFLSVNSIYTLKQKQMDRITEVKEKRAKTLAQAYLKSFPAHYAVASADFIRRLSLLIPLHIRLTSMEIRGSLQSFEFSLVGFVSGPSQDTGPRELAARVQRMAAVSKVDVKYTESPSAGTSIEFIISGEVDLE